ncbi:suppressor of fused domain protein [Aquipuribacter sp. SD81]|uniref:suppressor of fused domain protein n=1 Tax=Aquipuribacter sp. SD81 TaxID=3127703 RepID=UPI003016592A
MWGKKKRAEANDDPAPGWDAIGEALRAQGLHDPVHLSTGHLPDQDGAYALDAYRTRDGYLLMTLGLSELFGKVSDDPDVSGWGLELTMRVPRDGDEPPQRALKLLLKLSEYIYGQGRPLLPGHRMSPGGPITGSDDTRLTALAFAQDPVMGPLRTPNGTVDFVTVVGITEDELERMKRSSTEAVLTELRAADPLLVTSPAR